MAEFTFQGLLDAFGGPEGVRDIGRGLSIGAAPSLTPQGGIMSQFARAGAFADTQADQRTQSKLQALKLQSLAGQEQARTDLFGGLNQQEQAIARAYPQLYGKALLPPPVPPETPTDRLAASIAAGNFATNQRKEQEEIAGFRSDARATMTAAADSTVGIRTLMADNQGARVFSWTPEMRGRVQSRLNDIEAAKGDPTAVNKLMGSASEFGLELFGLGDVERTQRLIKAANTVDKNRLILAKNIAGNNAGYRQSLLINQSLGQGADLQNNLRFVETVADETSRFATDAGRAINPQFLSGLPQFSAAQRQRAENPIDQARTALGPRDQLGTRGIAGGVVGPSEPFAREQGVPAKLPPGAKREVYQGPRDSLVGREFVTFDRKADAARAVGADERRNPDPRDRQFPPGTIIIVAGVPNRVGP